MRSRLLAAALTLFSAAAVCAQELPGDSGLIGKRGTARGPASAQYGALAQDELKGALGRVSQFANTSYSEKGLATRGARDAQLYKDIAPSVVLIVVKDGMGTGSLIQADGTILTNWHVIKGYKEVGVIFKPAVEGQKPEKSDIVRGQVIRVDEVADLALVKVAAVPAGRVPVKLGEAKDAAIGLDVFAIGHPSGIDWTYTKGIISQMRQGYEWVYEDRTKHKADVVQTQTPINPGNSGGPLLGENGVVVGVNSFGSEGEGLNFAVAVSEIKAFLARKEDRKTTEDMSMARNRPADCEPKLVDDEYDKERKTRYESVDMTCDGVVDAVTATPDDKNDPITLMVDNNGDEKPDTWLMDYGHDGKWDVSFWQTKFDGKVDMVGIHSDGSTKPTSYVSYEKYKAEIARLQAKK